MDEVKNNFTLKLNYGFLKITAISPKIFRISFSPTSDFSDRSSTCLIPQLTMNGNMDPEEDDISVNLKTNQLMLRIDKQIGKCSILDTSGKTIFQEGERSLKPTNISGEAVYSIQQNFIWKSDEALFGLGQFQDGKMNLRGCSRRLIQKNTVAVNPMLISSKGYGILWHNTSFTKYVDNSKASFFWSEVADEIDYFFIYGPSTDEVISGYRTLTGKAPMLGKWAFGYIQCKERYKSQEELLNIVEKHRELEIPLDLIVQDWKYWPKFQWGQKSFDFTRYPDPEAMVKELHDKWNVHMMISIWPRLSPEGANFKELEEQGFLYKKPILGTRIYDAFNELARNLYWNQTNDGLFSKGIDAWWCDATEPEASYPWYTLKKYKKRMLPSIGTAARYLNAYSLYHSKGIYENQRKVTNKKRVMNLTRSAFIGQQRFGAITWSGDISASWKILQDQIPAGLGFCLSGNPYWTQDIGGFFVWPWKYRGGCKNEKYRELYTRWFQLGAFNPLFRSHGTFTPREVWQFGEPGTKYYDALIKTIKLRYSLIPYIYSLAGKVSQEDYTIMRGLVFDFPNDSKVFNIKDQFMFGPSILVCPVLKSKITSREVYLPQFEESSKKWINFWTGDVFNPGQTYLIETALDQIPLFIPTGSIIPMGPDIQYATESNDPLRIQIYPGHDAEFVLYEDENDNYNYEQGEFSLIRMKWTDESRTFSIENREGEFPGMLQSRNFDIKFNGESKSHPIRYIGSFIEIKV